jgi:hypothetical protein
MSHQRTLSTLSLDESIELDRLDSDMLLSPVEDSSSSSLIDAVFNFTNSILGAGTNGSFHH